MPSLRQIFAGWRGLGVFWASVAVLLAVGGVTLHLLGQPAPRPVAAPPAPAPQHPAAQSPTPPHPAPEATPPQRQPEAAANRPGRDTPGPIADPDPALLEPVTAGSSTLLPRIALDGRMPMQVYAAGFDGSTRRPRVGLLLAGVGLNQVDSDTAIRTLPGGISLAFSPYAQNPTKLLAAARAAEHEYLLSIPMEPQGYPLNDPGKQALMTNLSQEQNRTRLDWALSRIQGYVGTTGALGDMRGERFASLADEMNGVLKQLSQRGLLYVDARPGAAQLPLVWSRSVDLVVDDPATAPDIDDKLSRLSRLAREKGSALGLAGSVRPVTIQRLAAWAGNLAADGLALAPVSALVVGPAR